MKKKLIISLICLVMVVALTSILVIKLTDKNPYPPTQDSSAIEKIGIGGGGTFLNPMIDPTDEKNYFATSDMGGLYYSHDYGKSWNRTEAVGVFWNAHIAQNGTIFTGGYGVYASYDKGETIEMIYPKNVKYSVSRCGWNENLMIAENYDRGYFKCVTSDSLNIYFITIDWEGNLRLLKSDYHGNNLEILHTEKIDNLSDNVGGIDNHICVDETGIYFSMGNHINKYKFSDKTIDKVYTATGYVKDLEIIGDKFFILDDGNIESEILYTTDWENYENLLDYNNLATSYDHYGFLKTFNWHFNELSGTSMNSIFLSMCSTINETNEVIEGIMKFDGQNFNWVFDSVFNTKHSLELGWSYGGHGPIFGVFASSHNSDMALVVSAETIYEMTYTPQNTREIKTLHCDLHSDGKYSTNGLDIQTTYSVKEDPFNSNHIIICTTDMGLQNSYDNGKSWSRMNCSGEDWSIYNTCYDLYFDTKNKDVIYGLWSSIHDAPYNPLLTYKDYTKGAFAVSYNGGLDWDFTYSSGIPKDAIPVKFSIIENGDFLTIAVATFNRGFYISYDTGKTFQSISDNMITHSGLIFGEDIVLTKNEIYCLTAPIIIGNGSWIPSELYKYNLSNGTTTQINLGEIVIARSLTYSNDKGLYINVIPTFYGHWFEEYNDYCWINENGGIYHYDGNTVTLVASNNTGIFNSAFAQDGNLYATDTYGRLMILKESGLEVVVDGLFNMLKNISISNTKDIIYVTCFGGGTYKIDLSKL